MDSRSRLLVTRLPGIALFGFIMVHAVGESSYGQIAVSVAAQAAPSRVAEIPDDAEPLELVDAGPAEAFRLGDHVWVRTTSTTERITLPRFAAPIRAMQWLSGGAVAPGQKTAEIKLAPEPDTWVIQFSAAVPPDSILAIQLDAAARLVDELRPILSAGDGSFWLPAHEAKTYGSTLRYEPQTYKNTVGYWTKAEDFAEWKLQLDRPGRFRVGVLQGCGQGHGGSRGRISLRSESAEASTVREEAAVQELRSGAVLEFDVEDTGHFQNFRWRDLGEIELDEPGIHVLKLGPVEIRKAALMDVRAIHLVRLP